MTYLNSGSLLFIMKQLTSPLIHENEVILSEYFTNSTCMFYENKKLIIVYLDGSDPPDYLLFIPYDKLVKEPLLNYYDQRIVYKKDFFVRAEYTWSNNVHFFENYVSITEDDYGFIFSLDYDHSNIETVKKWVIKFDKPKSKIIYVGNGNGIERIVEIEYSNKSVDIKFVSDDEYDSSEELSLSEREVKIICLGDDYLFNDSE